MDGIRTGKGGGLASNMRWATVDGYRLVAYAQTAEGEGGGYSLNHHVEGIGWCLCPDHEPAPEDIERALCEALGLEYVWDDRYTLATDEPGAEVLVPDDGEAARPVVVTWDGAEPWSVEDILACEG